MAIRAVFQDRRVLPEEWAATFRVAAETIFVDGALNKLAWIGRTMRIVATRAGDFPFAVGHMRRPLQLGAAHGMALQAQLRLRFLHTFIFRKGSVIPGIG